MLSIGQQKRNIGILLNEVALIVVEFKIIKTIGSQIIAACVRKVFIEI